MKTDSAVTSAFHGTWDEDRFRRWCESARARLNAPAVSLGILSLTPDYFEHAEEALEVVRVHARTPLLVGVSTGGVICGGEEFEDQPGAALQLLHLPGARLRAVHADAETVAGLQSPSAWHEFTGVPGPAASSWLVFGEPFHLDGEAWLRSWNAAYPGIPTVGGLASGAAGGQDAQIYLDGAVHGQGLVALHVGGEVSLDAVVSQGCTPIGQPWTVTRAERNLIFTIGNRPAYSVLVDTFNGLTQEEKERAQGNLFVGIASSEYREEFHRGDFLVRNLLGADPHDGKLAVGALPRTGQTIQFHRRDASTATQDIVVALGKARARLGGATPYGGVLTVCNGRGRGLFGRPNHDAGLVQEILGPLPLTGFFGNGELGPVGGRNFLHGYTACLGLFVPRTRGAG